MSVYFLQRIDLHVTLLFTSNMAESATKALTFYTKREPLPHHIEVKVNVVQPSDHFEDPAPSYIRRCSLGLRAHAHGHVMVQYNLL